MRVSERNKMSDLDNHQEIFIFYHCCKALERVSILNMELERHFFDIEDEDDDDDHNVYDEDEDHDESTFIQNILIKFVRSVPSLRWFRSDLTSENMTMLRMERTEIELLN